ncbi:BTB/POZ protein, partial [Cercophora newfieldiana]
LLFSPKYSDMTITCRGEEFKAHRAIVCPQSPFFDAALSGSFLESNEQKIDLPDDDPAIVKLLFEFFYTGTYQDGTYDEEYEEDEKMEDVHDADNSVPKDVPRDGCKALYTHLHLYILADKYDIPALRILARNRFKAEA